MVLPLAPVAQGQPHVAAHNAERDEINALGTAMSGKAATVHTHTTAQVTGLDTALAGKSSTGHLHELNEVNGLEAALADTADVVHDHTFSQINDQASYDQIPPYSTLTIDKAKNGGTWPARPTSRTDICVVWTGNTDPGAAALDGDKWDVVP